MFFLFIVVHFMAEMSNPTLILRTLLKLKGLKNTTVYMVNDIIFAVSFILLRMFLTPPLLIYLLEGDKVIYAVKFGVTFVLYVQLFWCYRILFIVAETLKDLYEKKLERKVPLWLNAFYNGIFNIQNNKKVKLYVNVINVIWIFIIPHYYYGFVRKTLFNFL